MLDQPFLYCYLFTIVTITSLKITCDNNIITTHEIPSGKPIPLSLRKGTRLTRYTIHTNYYYCVKWAAISTLFNGLQRCFIHLWIICEFVIVTLSFLYYKLYALGSVTNGSIRSLYFNRFTNTGTNYSRI